ncbi:MAG: CHC2 zinc finger domain-containing protein [Clostridia bacterium]|jgi:DNA primase|nr:CHC2 zinc finger domain-containing protein [Clostridia bacterium]
MKKYKNREKYRKESWLDIEGKFSKKELEFFQEGINKGYRIFKKFYTDEEVESIRKANDIVEVISEYGTTLHSKESQNIYMICTFHNEKTPSLTISRKEQLYHCFGCGAAGSVFKFIERVENLKFGATLAYLEARALHLGYLEHEIGSHTYEEYENKLPNEPRRRDSLFQWNATKRKQEKKYEIGIEENNLDEIFYNTLSDYEYSSYEELKDKMTTTHEDIKNHLDFNNLNHTGLSIYDINSVEDIVAFEYEKKKIENEIQLYE